MNERTKEHIIKTFIIKETYNKYDFIANYNFYFAILPKYKVSLI